MLNLDEVKRLMKNEAMSDEEASAIRDVCYELAGIVIDQWLAERQTEEENKGGPTG